MISIEDIKVVFGKGTPLEKRALNGVSLTIEQGSFVTVIGSNGAGKSTLLGVLAGDVLASEGKVLIGDIDVTRKQTAARAGLVARVFQDPLTGSCGSLSIEEKSCSCRSARRAARIGGGPRPQAPRSFPRPDQRTQPRPRKSYG